MLRFRISCQRFKKKKAGVVEKKLCKFLLKEHRSKFGDRRREQKV